MILHYKTTTVLCPSACMYQEGRPNQEVAENWCLLHMVNKAA